MTHNKGNMALAEQGYNVIVTGRHVHITNGMKEHAVEKISRLEKIGDRIIDVNVTMDIQKLDHRVDILMKYGHTVIRSHGVSNDMYVSIDQAVDKLERQLKRYKNKLQDHHMKGYPVFEMPISVWALSHDEAEEINEQIAIETQKEETQGYHKVVSQETRPLKILSEEEAIMKMELSRDQFMVYRSENDRRLKVIFRKSDGNYGVIQPEG